MKKGILVGVAVLIILMGVGYFVAAPFLALNAIRHGFEERNAEKVAAYIDFPLLRQNLKEQVGAAALAAADVPSGDEAFGNAFAALAPGFIGNLIDSYVTPSGLTQLMEHMESQAPSDSDQEMLPDPEQALADASYGFDSLSEFSVRIPHPETSEEVRLVLTRSGLDWKVTNIEFPIAELLQNN